MYVYPHCNNFSKFCRESGLDKVCHKLCICNAIRDALEGEVLSVRFQQLLLRPNKWMVDFILEVLAFSRLIQRSLRPAAAIWDQSNNFNELGYNI